MQRSYLFELRVCSHLATTNQIFQVVRNGLHDYQCYCSYMTTEKKNKIMQQTHRCRQVRTMCKQLHWRHTENVKDLCHCRQVRTGLNFRRNNSNFIRVTTLCRMPTINFMTIHCNLVLCNAVACPHLERSGMGTACSRSASAHLYHAGSRLLPYDGAAD